MKPSEPHERALTFDQVLSTSLHLNFDLSSTHPSCCCIAILPHLHTVCLSRLHSRPSDYPLFKFRHIHNWIKIPFLIPLPLAPRVGLVHDAEWRVQRARRVQLGRGVSRRAV
eukprot:6208094-Pleurochrysis_carterae.AAC.1